MPLLALMEERSVTRAAQRVGLSQPAMSHALVRLRIFTVPTDADFDAADVAPISEAFGSPYPRERLYDNRWVVIAGADAPPEASAEELLRALPHVVFDAGPHRIAPYAILEEQQVPYRVAAVMGSLFDLRVEEFPFPAPGLAIDAVWNPRLADEGFIGWLREVLVGASRIRS